MKNLLVVMMALVSVVASAEVEPNQRCAGVNDYNQLVETAIYVGKKVDGKFSEATLAISLGGVAQPEIYGVITNESDLMNARMFKNNNDTLRYLTTGLLMDANSYRLRLNMKCGKFRF